MDLFLTELAILDATMKFVLQDPDPLFLYCFVGALKRSFYSVFVGIKNLLGMLGLSILLF